MRNKIEETVGQQDLDSISNSALASGNMWTCTGETTGVHIQCHQFENDPQTYIIMYQIRQGYSPDVINSFCLDTPPMTHISFYFDELTNVLFVEGIDSHMKKRYFTVLNRSDSTAIFFEHSVN